MPAVTAVMAMTICSMMPQTASAQNEGLGEHMQVKKKVTRAKLLKELSFLCDSICQGRAFATSGGAEAAFWIQREFERIGLTKLGESYGKRVNMGPEQIGRNIVAMLPSSKGTSSDRYVIVGAHYDHLGELGGRMYPGADANASGTVALINIAEMLKTRADNGITHGQNIIFVAFDGKERDLAGSKALWEMIRKGELRNPITGRKITKDKISLMVNMDQIGSSMSPLASGRKDYLIMLGNNSLRPEKQNTLKTCNRKYAIDMDLAFNYYGSQDFTRIFYRLSDQRIFIDNHIPAVLFTSGITMNTNKTWDSPETIDLEIFKRRIFLIYHWIEMYVQ